MTGNTDDTTYGTNFDDAIKIFEGQGFLNIYEESFLDEERGIADSLKIFWRNGILLVCESFEGFILNNAIIHYNWLPNSSLSGLSRFMDEGKFVEVSKGRKVLSGSHDMREGFMRKLTLLEENGTFLSEWIAEPVLWLANYVEERENIGGDLKEIVWDKISSLPEEVRKSLKILL